MRERVCDPSGPLALLAGWESLVSQELSTSPAVFRPWGASVPAVSVSVASLTRDSHPCPWQAA